MDTVVKGTENSRQIFANAISGRIEAMEYVNSDVEKQEIILRIQYTRPRTGIKIEEYITISYRFDEAYDKDGRVVGMRDMYINNFYAQYISEGLWKQMFDRTNAAIRIALRHNMPYAKPRTVEAKAQSTTPT